MKHKMKTWLTVINDFAHDLFTGLWASTILVTYLLHEKTNFSQGTLLDVALHDVMKVFFWLGIFSILIILATGIFRLINYKSENNDDSGPIKKRILILKHILLTMVFIGGTYLAYSYAF